MFSILENKLTVSGVEVWKRNVGRRGKTDRQRSPFQNVFKRNVKEMLVCSQPFHFVPTIEFSFFEALGSLFVPEVIFWDEMENGICSRQILLPFILSA